MTPLDPLVRASLAGTVVFVLVSVAATAAPDALRVPTVVVDVTLAATGFVAFVLTLLRAAERSRREAVTLPGIWWLSGTAPAPVRRLLLGSLGVQVVVGVVTAVIRPYTVLAFGTLVPLYGLGVAGLWAARHGTFPPRRSHPPV